MGSRITGSEAEKVYEAAQKWIDSALRKDDSLFTPGKPIWSSRWLRELRERFLERPDVGQGNFYDKLEVQLEGSPPEVYQLMGEALYVHLLMVKVNGMSGETKKELIDRVLRWSSSAATIPDDLVAGLTSGLTKVQALRTNRHHQVGFIIEFVEQWKERNRREHQRLLADPQAFKQFVIRRSLRSRLFREAQAKPRGQQHALLHLVYPDTFEGIASVAHKRHIANASAFARYITEHELNVDSRLTQIRLGLEHECGRDFDFYDDDIRAQWDRQLIWDEFVRRAKEIVASGRLESDEVVFKLEIGRKLEDARRAVISGMTEWPRLLRTGLTGYSHHPLPWQAADRFRKWIDEHPDSALEVLRAFWEEGDIDVEDRLRSLADAVPTTVASRPGVFINLASVLLMGLDVKRYPPFRVGVFNQAYDFTGYGRTDWAADEGEQYEYALGFLSRVIEEAGARGLNLRHRLDAQSVVWQMQYDDPRNLSYSEVDDPNELPSHTLKPEPDLPALADELYLSPGFLEEIETLLSAKKQVIFQGPPGTGKTYVAQKLARHLAGSDDRVTLVQFHPSYAYEDFVQGYRPALAREGHLRFELRNGPLWQAAERARDEPNADHFLVIDEINRGNLGKVFGELYFLLEYRDQEMRLQYSNKTFSLPENLYVIGTMNTADRSIAMVDLALRRRFHFVAFHPDEKPVKGVLRRWLDDNAPDDMAWVADVVELANENLRDNRDAAIGPSYFMKDGLDEAWVKRIWKHSVLPYIEELLFGGEDRIGEFDLDTLRREAGRASAPGEDTPEAGGAPEPDPDPDPVA